MINPTVFVGENEGQPVLVQLEQSFGKGHSDKSRGSAVTFEIALPRVDGNGLPPQEDWPALEVLEAAIVKEFAETEDDWRYVARTYGEGVVRFCLYGRKTSSAAGRLARVLAEFPAMGEHRVTVQMDPAWAAYNAFFPGDEGKDDFAPSFRDDDVAPSSPRRPVMRDEQPWRGEESQAHPDQ